MSDWEASDSDTPASKPAPAVKPPVKASKWADEDAEDSPASDWEASSGDEKPPPSTSAAKPPKKKGTLKQKLAEKDAERARRIAAGEDEEYNSDDVLDPREKARRDRERELNADLSNAADLLGTAAVGGTSSKELDAILSFQPRTKDDFEKLSAMIIEHVIKQHHSKPLFPSFVEYHARQLATTLKDVEIRKVASGLTTLANEKQKEQRDIASGKKKKAAKPVLGAAKASSKYDTNTYDEALDDFGPDDFM
ncbi:eukaryotic translation initiation factor 3 subunit J [Flagelloscypha sp. PMI_526]|nr:eukaryotic translation initiation factor 3 subunit J [Flagelloscypha sp. PMI_526]